MNMNYYCDHLPAYVKIDGFDNFHLVCTRCGRILGNITRSISPEKPTEKPVGKAPIPPPFKIE